MGCIVDVFSPHTIHLRVKIREFILGLICISASSVPMNYFYLLEFFFGDFKNYVCGLFEIYRISQ